MHIYQNDSYTRSSHSHTTPNGVLVWKNHIIPSDPKHNPLKFLAGVTPSASSISRSSCPMISLLCSHFTLVLFQVFYCLLVQGVQNDLPSISCMKLTGIVITKLCLDVRHAAPRRFRLNGTWKYIIFSFLETMFSSGWLLILNEISHWAPQTSRCPERSEPQNSPLTAR